jgi:hypothetical protein
MLNYIAESHRPNLSLNRAFEFSNRIQRLLRNKQIITKFKNKSRDSSVGIATDYGLDSRASVLGRDKRFFSSPQCPDQLWGPPNFLHNEYRGAFP